VKPIADTEAGSYLHPVGRHALFLFGLGLFTLEPSSALAATTNNGDELPGWLELTLAALAASVGLAVLVAVIEMSLRMTRERSGRGEVEVPVLSALYAQRLYARALYGVAPAGVATAIALLRTEEVSTAAFLFAAMVLTGAILRSHRHPLHLMPIARYAFNAFVPAAGIAVAMVPAAFGNSLLAPQTAVVILIAAVITTLMAAWLENRFEADRPIRLAVIGRPTFAEKLTSELEETGIRGYTVVGYLGEGPPGPDTHTDWLGSLNDVRSAVQREGIDLLVIAPHKPRLAVFEQAAKACLDLPVRMIEATALYEDVLGHVPIGTINSAWFQFIMHPRYSPSSPLSKRVLDLVVSGLMGLASLPLMLLAALAVKLEDRGPVFYRQRRVGEEGREFQMVKFRTLRADADELMESHGEEELVTRAGRALRKTHLNELPQLFQVLKGDMSLVGPRPEPPALVEELSGLVPYYERRALVKPGLTGWAQVRCGYAGSHYGTAWKMCHDLYYIKHRSAQFDLLILVQTLHALLERSGEEEQLPAKDFILGDTVELARR
jgi:exopolysaccharide biosynthesis polyprenyl glycosylphosphotransferase